MLPEARPSTGLGGKSKEEASPVGFTSHSFRSRSTHHHRASAPRASLGSPERCAGRRQACRGRCRRRRWCTSAQPEGRKINDCWKRNRSDHPGPPCSFSTAQAPTSLPGLEEQRTPPHNLSAALCSTCLCQPGSAVVTDRQRGEILGINSKARSTFTRTFQDNTNDKSQHRFPLKYSLGKDQAVLQPCRPALKPALQHRAFRRRTLSTARCSMAKAVLLN